MIVMYKQPQPSGERQRSASRCGPTRISMGFFCVRARMSIYSKQSSRLPRCCLSYFLEAARWPLRLTLPTLRSLSRQSLRRDGAPLTHRARQRKPAWAVANTSKCCLQTASNSRPGVNVSRRARLCARLVPAHTPQPHKSQSSPRRVRGMHIWQVPQSLPAGAAPRRPAPRAVTTGSSAAGWPQRARNGGC